MKRTSPYSELIQAIERIYFKISLSVLHKRMDGYHKQISPNSDPYTNDIKVPLLECIDGIIAIDRDNPEHNNAIDHSDTPTVTTNPHIPEKYNTAELHVINKTNIGELSKYFKERNKNTAHHSGIGDKLELSTWEHIHAAIRYASKNDSNNAKLHANIANSACKELAHFMAKEEYMEFIMEVQKHLDTIKDASKSKK